MDLQQCSSALAGSQISSVRLVGEALDRIRESQPTVNAFRLVCRAAALDEAAVADHRLAAGERLPLLGIPIAIKDNIDIAGAPTAFGCGGEFEPKATDSEVVHRLKAAGAIVIGKTNTPEHCEWPFTHGPAFGHTRNPWHHDYTPGGSSGGSAAAVAARLVPAALGSDSGGSIRVPAAWTNLVGIKPQRGRAPLAPDNNDWHGVTAVGPLARTVADAALLLDIISGTHGSDSPVPSSFTQAARRDPARVKIALSQAIPFTFFPAALDPQVRHAVEKIATTLRELGHQVTAADPDYDPRLILSWSSRSSSGIARAHRDLPSATQIAGHTRWNVRFGRLSGSVAQWAHEVVEPILARKIGRIFDRFDVVLAPTTATPPPTVDAIDGVSIYTAYRKAITSCPYTFAWNVLGWPAINIPAGFTVDGLPVGAQLMGGPDSEATLISIASQLESRLQWHRHRPKTLPN
ncbi:amidase [Nocardia sp. NPDC088792]|uniref:amidase n=1 Tax=Nocardia sp. NPDC088792 TaxID=3364332 RepID=UPI00382918E5